MQIRSGMSMSADGYVTMPDGWPVLLADPGALPGGSVEIVYTVAKTSAQPQAVGE
ncbi:MAG TPA: hypothetical protein VG253_11810 [Streptosporangiaceae bacterium]|nr:hypothetical protein [Streptosporangiaceae bacterium]